MSIIEINQSQERFCKEGILEEYMKYCDGQESPPDFHLWTIITVMAIILGRNVWVDKGTWKIYPNLYTILVGESALTHKGTAMKYGLKVLGAAAPKLSEIGQKFTANSLSSFLKELSEGEAKKAEAHIVSPELSVLLGNSHLDDSLLKLLTDLWDSPDEHKYMTLSRGIEKAHNVCISLLGGSTPSWLRSSIPEESLEGGLFSRLLLIDRKPTGRKVPFPQLTLEARKAMENIIHDLRIMHNTMRGEFTMTNSANMVFAQWYCEMNQPEKATSFMRGYYGRKGDFVLKIAMILSANYSNSMKITDEDILFALEKLNENEAHTKELVKYMGTTQDGKKYAMVLQKIKRSLVNVPRDMKSMSATALKEGTYDVDVKVGVEHSMLMRSVGYQLKAADLAEVIDGLIQADEIQVVMLGAKKLYLTKDNKGDMI